MPDSNASARRSTKHGREAAAARGGGELGEAAPGEDGGADVGELEAVALVVVEQPRRPRWARSHSSSQRSCRRRRAARARRR